MWFRKQQQQAEPAPPEAPTAEDRNLFEYWDGTEKRVGDPLHLYRMMQNDPEFRVDVHPMLCDEGDDDAIEITLTAIRRAFGIQAFDPVAMTGLTQAETLQLWVAFCYWMDDVKKNTNPLPTLPQSTDATLPSSSEKTPNDSSVSGSTEGAKSSDRPIESAAP